MAHTFLRGFFKRLLPLAGALGVTAVAAAQPGSGLKPYVPPPAYFNADMLQIALGVLDRQGFADRVDRSRVEMRRLPARKVVIVDFAWQGAGRTLPGGWAQGFQVTIDETTGAVIDSTAYEK